MLPHAAYSLGESTFQSTIVCFQSHQKHQEIQNLAVHFQDVDRTEQRLALQVHLDSAKLNLLITLLSSHFRLS